ncbi:MAG: transglutaminase domain-containing protein [Erysipelotrichaceae bacterium]|nr:transglutaminase domain-containing protein [Erysipelotrichaceae bacterium]
MFKERPLETILNLLLLVLDFLILDHFTQESVNLLPTLLLFVYALLREMLLLYVRNNDPDNARRSRILAVCADVLLTVILFHKVTFPVLRLLLRGQSSQIGTFFFYFDPAELRPAISSLLKLILSIFFISRFTKDNRMLWLDLLSMGCFLLAELSRRYSANLQNALLLTLLFKYIWLRFSRKKKTNGLKLLAFVLIAAVLATTLQPAIARIKRPFMNGEDDNAFSIFDSRRTRYDFDENSGTPVGIVDYLLGSQLNMHTSSEMEEEIAFRIRTTVPVPRIRAFSCADYDMESAEFKLEDEHGNESGWNYFRNAVHGFEEISHNTYRQKMDITDYTDSELLFYPDNAFSIYNDSVGAYKDRYLYYAFEDGEPNYTFYFNPDRSYTYYDTPYLEYVDTTYKRVPEAMKQQLRSFLETAGIAKTEDPLQDIYALHTYLNENFRYTDSFTETPDGDPVLYFLNTSKEGDSRLFAAAETLLLRMLDVPTRYSFMYHVHHYIDGTAFVLYRDEYAYCEVFADNQWQTVEEYLQAEGYPLVHFGPLPEMIVEGTEKPENDTPEQIEAPGPHEDDGERAVARTARSEENRLVLRFTSDVYLKYLRAFSSGSYDLEKHSFLYEEDDSEALAKAGISDLDALLEKTLLQPAAKEKHKIEVQNVDAGKWVYAPYGVFEDSALSLYKDQNYLLKDEEQYVSYTLYYDDEDIRFPEEYESYVYDHYLELDPALKEELTDFLLAHNIDPSEKDKNGIITKLRALFRDEYVYRADILNIPDDKDPILYFLEESREGYCQHFAGAMTLLLRTCDIPARYVTGYAGSFKAGQINDVGSRQAHNWVEIYTREGWKMMEASLGDNLSGDLEIPEIVQTGSYDIPQRPTLSGYALPLGIGAAVILLLAVFWKKIAVFFEKLQPTLLQKINASYLLLKRHHFVNEEVNERMMRIRYSADKETREDLEVLNQRKEQLRRLYRLNNYYFGLLGDLLDEAADTVRIVFGNLVALFWK